MIQSFLVFFYLLDMCYDQFPENDLGGFLGMISPELWEDGKPADMAVYNDWKSMVAGTTLTDSEIVKTAYSFLEAYERKFGFHFSQTKHTLLSIADEQILAKARSFADEMNMKYHYPDFPG